MTTKHVKATPTTRYKLQNDYQKDRQRRKKLKILISTTIFLLVYGIFLKGALAEDGNVEHYLDSTSNKNNDVLLANGTGSAGVEANSTGVEVNSTGVEANSTGVEANSTGVENDAIDIEAGGTDVEDPVDNVPSPRKSNTDKGGGTPDNSTANLPIRPDRQGDGTEHEQAGDPHFRPLEITPFVPTVNFTNPGPKFRYGMDPIFKISNSILNIMVPEDTFPEGYVEIRDDKNFYLGRRVQNNDWLPLLNRYLLVCLVVALFLLLIIVIPFIAVCYCCFCCHKRCGRHCPPCDEKPDARRRCCYGFLLLLLIIGLLFGIIIAFASNRLLESGFAESAKNIGRSSDDTCRFLTNTNNHLKHLYINNYEEMVTQLRQILENAHEHIYLDLIDVTNGNAILELYEILANMPKALSWMIQLEPLEKEARFYASQLRDALRGAKRDLLYLQKLVCTNTTLCETFFSKTNISILDLGCLHYDNVPNTTIYIEAIKDIITEDLIEIPLNALKQLQKIRKIIKDLHEQIVPTFLKILDGGGSMMSEQAETISALVDKVITDIHLKTMRTTHSFDDIYLKLGVYRNLTNVILCTVLLAVSCFAFFNILICLIIGLCYGSFAKRRRGYRDHCCNKSTGATWLLIAMILIFLTFSIIALIGLFYFVFGLLAYHGACAPLRDTTSNNIFNSFDSLIDFYKLSPPAKTGYAYEDNTENPLPPIRLSTAINACRSNESIMNVLQLNDLYSLRNLKLLKILKDMSQIAADMQALPNVLKDLQLISIEDMHRLYKMAGGNLSTYHSRVYTTEMCRGIPRTNLDTINSYIHDKILFSKAQGDQSNPFWISYLNTGNQLKAYIGDLRRPLITYIENIHRIVKEIDKLILRSKFDFNETIVNILQDIKIAQDKITEKGVNFINQLTVELTRHTVLQVGAYKKYLIEETEISVGRCKPLAYIYENGVDIVCNRMVDPMNGFWMGVLLCCLLFLPILFVAHKLQCLYKKVVLYGTPVATGGCPECTGARGPIKPATVMVCSGGLGNTKCPCPSLRQNIPKPKSGDCPCSSQAIKDPRSPRRKHGRNNEEGGLINKRGDFFDVEAQQIIIFHRSHEFPKRKID